MCVYIYHLEHVYHIFIYLFIYYPVSCLHKEDDFRSHGRFMVQAL